MGIFKGIMLTIIIIVIIISTAIFIGENSPKDSVLETYDSIIKFFGDDSLTSNSKLKGKREYGIDHYVGTYVADYKKFSGTEYLFGGTTLEREQGDNIHVKIQIDNSQGKIEVIMRLKEIEEVIANEDGTYEFDFNVKDGGNYLFVQADKYTGNIKIEIN